ncbi:Uncharacterized conserved protein, DUF1697 family [Zobellia uliginosa]|uniref:Uncharacterized conserved protein, DUF1697 family n=1 Tax=Zobellia uliginosa TaxID=143224 RepID=A0ABY1KJG1_9FLAO|nr:DUF1697 domain-containing protein [Zobellia uliginosa]SIS41660.1 Uncharacterized conserved protein, DUF1697 family [Zobellia uliginosa]
MKVYIALLRGINVGGKKRLPMADLRAMLNDRGFSNVKTYIQSGNVVFQSHEEDTGALEVSIAEGIKSSFGFEVSVLVKTKKEFENIVMGNPFTDSGSVSRKQVYFVLLKNPPEKERSATFGRETYANEDFTITDYCVYLLCKAGYGKAKLNNNRIEGKLKVEATARNYGTMVKLLEMVP